MKSSRDHPWPRAKALGEAKAEAIFKKTYPVLYKHFKRIEEYKDEKTGKLKGLRRSGLMIEQKPLTSLPRIEAAEVAISRRSVRGRKRAFKPRSTTAQKTTRAACTN
jgi:hypothetical protein